MVGVAAHESGHALQHQAAYGLFNFRMAIVPVTQFASMAYMGIFFAGFIFRQFFHQFILIAILMFAVMTLFQLVTLPVEYDASRRAKEQLFRLGLVREDERSGYQQSSRRGCAYLRCRACEFGFESAVSAHPRSPEIISVGTNLLLFRPKIFLQEIFPLSFLSASFSKNLSFTGAKCFFISTAIGIERTIEAITSDR